MRERRRQFQTPEDTNPCTALSQKPRILGFERGDALLEHFDGGSHILDGDGRNCGKYLRGFLGPSGPCRYYLTLRMEGFLCADRAKEDRALPRHAEHFRA